MRHCGTCSTAASRRTTLTGRRRSTFSWGYASWRRSRHASEQSVDAFAAADDDLEAALDAMEAAQSGDLAAERRKPRAREVSHARVWHLRWRRRGPGRDRALNAGETYKTSRSTWRCFQLRADCGLRRGGLSLS